MEWNNILNRAQQLSWRGILALLVSACGFAGFLSGVEVSERDISQAGIGTHLYNTLGLFILGGMDLGTPVRGPAWGRALLWIGYFGAPLLTGSTIVEWVRRLLNRPDLYLKTASDHIIVIGTGEIARSILGKVRSFAAHAPVIMVDRSIPQGVAAEFTEEYQTRVVMGDYTSDFFLRSLRIEQARQVVVAGDHDFDNFEAASKILAIRPDIGHRLLVHSNRLRFLRMLSYSNVVNSALTFNSYDLAAQYLVREVMLRHFEDTVSADTVVIAGFGRFGQTILEELERLGASVVSDVAIIDNDAERRILITEEQVARHEGITRHAFQGDLGHPGVWLDLERKLPLQDRKSLILLATGADDENLRTGLWIKRKHPDAKVMVRTKQPSVFARNVCDAAGIDTFALSQMMYQSMPDEWFNY